MSVVLPSLQELPKLKFHRSGIQIVLMRWRIVSMAVDRAAASELRPRWRIRFWRQRSHSGRGGRGGPPIQLTPEQKSEYQSKIDELDTIVKGLRAGKTNVDLIADVDIFAKAGKWLLEFPQDFANAQAVTNYLAVLDQGIERGHQLQKGQSPWVTEKGRKVLGYYSDLDGSVQPMGVTIPDGYDAAEAGSALCLAARPQQWPFRSQFHQRL